jgi:photosynthetic reaction center cytochrome c subunit
MIKSMMKSMRIGLVALSAMVLQGCFEAPPMDSEQSGFRGTGMLQTTNPDVVDPILARNVLPDAIASVPAVPGGPTAGQIYQNVQVLGDLPIAEFARTMAAITEWVSPEQGCAYCHEGANFAEDNLYTKVVSRRMMEMTMEINTDWSSHVGDTGVTCLTCHRGKNVPEYIWFEQDGPPTAGGMSAKGYQQNHAAMNVGSTSMLSDPFSKYLTTDPEAIRVISQTALPQAGDARHMSSTQATENTYSLMVHMSDSLGVNCTYCHNTRAFTSWDQSPPARVTAWHGLQMVSSLNDEYLEPLGPTYPDHRMGPLGDAPKASCATCHQNVNKPFAGASMLDDYPIWRPTAAAE